MPESMYRGGPWALQRLRHEMERMFSDFLGGDFEPGLSTLLSAGGYPSLNLWETEGALVVEAEIPGLEEKDLSLQLEGGGLTIAGERKDVAGKDAVCHRRERARGRFSRTVQLPVDVDPEKVQASLKEGVLTVTMPKAAAAQPRRIAIKATKQAEGAKQAEAAR